MSIFKSAISYSLSNLMIKFGGIVILPFLTRILTPEEFGTIGLLVTISSVLTVILGLGLYNPQNNMQVKNEGFSDYLISQFILISCNIILVFIIGLFVLKSQYIIDYFSKNNIYNAQLILVYLVSVISSINVIVSSYHKMNGRYYLVSLSSIINFVVFYGMTFLLVGFYKLGIEGYLYGYVTSQLTLLLIQIKEYFSSSVGGYPSIHNIKYAFKNGIPVFFAELSGRINEVNDRLILAKYITSAEMGLYILASTGGRALQVLTSGFINTMYPRIYRNPICEKNKALLELFFIPLSFVVILAQISSQYVFPLILSNEYSEVCYFFSWLLPASAMQYLYFIDHYYHVREKSSYVTHVSFWMTICSIVSSIILVPFWGVLGAVVCCGASLLFRFVILTQGVKRDGKVVFNIYLITFFVMIQYVYPVLMYLKLGSWMLDGLIFLIVLGALLISSISIKKQLSIDYEDKY